MLRFLQDQKTKALTEKEESLLGEIEPIDIFKNWKFNLSDYVTVDDFINIEFERNYDNKRFQFIHGYSSYDTELHNSQTYSAFFNLIEKKYPHWLEGIDISDNIARNDAVEDFAMVLDISTHITYFSFLEMPMQECYDRYVGLAKEQIEKRLKRKLYINRLLTEIKEPFMTLVGDYLFAKHDKTKLNLLLNGLETLANKYSKDAVAIALSRIPHKFSSSVHYIISSTYPFPSVESTDLL